ncbi:MULTISPECIES: hypothetical protein [unclassified Streptomyces]|uniref:Uncharacterized protein n=1 Tax=Streptomyces sp. NBC_00093 TaxID=2975649 RepID=A0AAU2A5P8_9ACTN|nr:hypothetical protein [Streptomyces sp. GQFP]UIX34312.1 hypothetical protein LUX31_32285 [Streptomyces sp. GQFP]
MKLVSCTTGQEITPGATLHMQSGPTAGRAWRFEHIVERPDGSHHVHVTRASGKLGRVPGQYHPVLFGCEIAVDITWRQNIRNTVRHAWTKADDYLMAGVFALVPLAFFEHYQWAESITSALGFGGH